MQSMIFYGGNARARRMLETYMNDFARGMRIQIVQCSSADLKKYYPRADTSYTFVQREDRKDFSQQMAKLRRAGYKGTKIISVDYRKNETHDGVVFVLGRAAHGVVKPLRGRKTPTREDKMDLLFPRVA